MQHPSHNICSLFVVQTNQINLWHRWQIVLNCRNGRGVIRKVNVFALSPSGMNLASRIVKIQISDGCCCSTVSGRKQLVGMWGWFSCHKLLGGREQREREGGSGAECALLPGMLGHTAEIRQVLSHKRGRVNGQRQTHTHTHTQTGNGRRKQAMGALSSVLSD